MTAEVIAPGGTIVASGRAPRGQKLTLDASGWPDGPYEVRFTTTTASGKTWATHLPWFKGDARAGAAGVIEKAKGVDVKTPAGKTRRMLADLVRDRTGGDVAKAGPEALRRTHAAAFESAELDLEAAGKTGRVRAHGFVRLAWVDEVDGSVQFCRAYLPPGYRRRQDAAPLIMQLHGYNPANPELRALVGRVRTAGTTGIDTEFSNRGADGLIYLEPHGRGNTLVPRHR